MINKKNLVYIVILFLGSIFWGVGMKTSNIECLNFSYSIFSGWVVGVLCNMHERERKIEITEQLNNLLKSIEEKNEIVGNLNEMAGICQTVQGIVSNYFMINGVDQKKKEFSQHSLELSKISTSKIESKYFNEAEEKIIHSLKIKIFNMMREFDLLQDHEYEKVPNSTYASPDGFFIFSFEILKDSQKMNQLVNERNKEIYDLKQGIEELKRKE